MKTSAFMGVLQESKKVTNLPLHNHDENHLTFLFTLSCPHCKNVLLESLKFWTQHGISERLSLNFIVENSKGSKLVSDFNQKQLGLLSNAALLHESSASALNLV